MPPEQKVIKLVSNKMGATNSATARRHPKSYTESKRVPLPYHFALIHFTLSYQSNAFILRCAAVQGGREIEVLPLSTFSYWTFLPYKLTIFRPRFLTVH